MKWLRYFVLLLPLIFSVSFSFSKQLDSCKVVDCHQVNGSGCFGSVGDACVSAGYSYHGYWSRWDGTFSCDGNDIGTTIKGTIYCSECPDPFDVSTCDSGDPDDPCDNGKDPATCDMEDPPPDDPNPDDLVAMVKTLKLATWKTHSLMTQTRQNMMMTTNLMIRRVK